MAMRKIKKGDQVVILAGKDKGKREQQKKALLTPKEKRKAKNEKKNNSGVIGT